MRPETAPGIAPEAALAAALQAWGDDDFARRLRDALLAGDALFAPLQRAITRGSHALVEHAELLVLRSTEHDGVLQLDAGVVYASITPGCACEGDPTPMSELPEYATLRIRIDRASAAATVELLAD
ncbi:hypothetical protein GALL_378970 [mine drainage metagenome]|jgi:hypothetical protein|uniref:Uncharacterized protein n=1 Tax=mine drainage metagenome TaxID=410659 RepID=A0A1J5Q9P5_9ZZZZ